MGVDDTDAAEPVDRGRVAILGLWTAALGVALTLLLISDTVSAATF